MIKYRLRCARAHEFEAWFASGALYEAQESGGEISCPQCGSCDVGKAIMAPNISARDQKPESSGPAKAKLPQAADLLREMQRSLLAGAEDVGAKFPEEARKIHYGETTSRGICGTASGEDARALLDEGIEILAFPPLPEDAN